MNKNTSSILLLLICILLGCTVSSLAQTYSVNCGGFPMKRRGWTSSGSTKGLIVKTPSGSVNKFTYSDAKLNVLPKGEKYTEYLYKSVLWSSQKHMKLSFKVEAGVKYKVKLHFCEFTKKNARERVFHISLNGKTVFKYFDIIKQVKLRYNPLVKEFTTTPKKTDLIVKLTRHKGNVMISGVEVIPEPAAPTPPPPPPPPPPAKLDSETLQFSPASLDLGVIPIGGQSVEVTTNVTSPIPVTIHAIQFSGESRLDEFSFSYRFGELGKRYTGGINLVLAENVTIDQTGVPLHISLYPSTEKQYKMKMNLYSGATNPVIVGVLEAEGNGDANTIAKGHSLHPIVSAPLHQIFYDHDVDGVETVYFNSEESHTHAPGRELDWDNCEWVGENDEILGYGRTFNTTVGVGRHSVVLIIYDDVGDASAEELFYYVADPARVPGAFVRYFDGVDDIKELLGSPEPLAASAEILEQLQLQSQAGRAYPYGFIAQASKEFKQPVKLAVQSSSDLQYQLLVNGKDWNTNGEIEVKGKTTIKLIGIVTKAADIATPPTVQVTLSPIKKNPLGWMYHNQNFVQPVISSLTPAVASNEGGEPIVLRGVGFDFNKAVVSVAGVEIPATSIIETGLDLDGAYMSFRAPAVAEGGAQEVTVTAGTRTSNSLVLQYEAEEVFAPVQFRQTAFVTGSPMTAIAYCFGHVFVATSKGGKKAGGSSIEVYNLADDFSEMNKVTSVPVQRFSNMNGYTLDTILGLACDPWGSDDDFDVYFSISKVYPSGGQGNSAASETLFSAAIMKINSKNNFSKPTFVIQNLPTSDHDHAVNGLAFLDDGRLLICVGGNTNAGLPNAKLGNLEEGPLTGAILQANVKSPTFNGIIKYGFQKGANPRFGNNALDMRNSDALEVVSGDVKTFAVGLRNPYGIAVCPDGSIYATDNGPNKGFGGRICGTNGATPTNPGDYNGDVDPGTKQDKLNLIVENNYYGHPNPSRARMGDTRQFCSHLVDSPGTADYTPPITALQSSSDGIACYRAEVFNGAGKGDLYIQAYTKQYQYRAVMQAGVRSFQLQPDKDDGNRANTPGLAVTIGPGGSVLSAEYSCKTQPCRVLANVPTDTHANSGAVRVYQIDPYRAPVKPKGATTFEISGDNFPATLCSVSFGEVAAKVTSQNKVRIRGLIPALEDVGEHDVSVTCGAKTIVLQGHYIALKNL